MRTAVISFVLGSENRKIIVRTMFEYPKRQWSCSALEDLTKISHATVFRTLNGLRYFGVLKSVKINKKDILYELIETPLTNELKRIINIEKITVRKIINNFINKVKREISKKEISGVDKNKFYRQSKNIHAAILYGSSVKGTLKPESDIDILIILDQHNNDLEEKILNTAAEMSSNLNRTISAVIMDIKEINKEKNKPFIKSVKENMEVIYGKKPF